MLLPLVAVTLIRASLPFITLLVVIPSTSPTTYPEPPVLDVTEAEEISPNHLASCLRLHDGSNIIPRDIK